MIEIQIGNITTQMFRSRPFWRSGNFMGCSIVMVLLFIWEMRKMYQMRSVNPCLSDAILYLALLPLGMWAYSLYLHHIIRKLLEVAGQHTSLNRWYWTMPLFVAFMVFWVTFAIVNCHH